MLLIARAHAKQELELKTEEGRKKRGREQGTSEEQEGPELSVEVMGKTLPKLSHQDEIQVSISQKGVSIYSRHLTT